MSNRKFTTKPDQSYRSKFTAVKDNAAVQTDTALFGLRVLMIIIPMIGLAISVIFFGRKYKLSDDRMEQILSDINEREKQDTLTSGQAG